MAGSREDENRAATVVAKESEPGRSQHKARNPSSTQPKSKPISPFYGSFSMDSGGWSLIPNLILISNVLMLSYILDCYACGFVASYIYCWV